MTVLSLPTADDTRELGRRLARVVRAGDLIILDGPLGAGKTVLVQGIGAGLGVQGAVTSPTFVIARVHRPAPGGRGLPLVHVDAYRLTSLAEVDDLDLDTGLDEAVTVVEWGEGKVERLAEAHLLVRLRRADGGATPASAESADPRTAEPDARSASSARPATLRSSLVPRYDARSAELIAIGGDWAERLPAVERTAAG